MIESTTTCPDWATPESTGPSPFGTIAPHGHPIAPGASSLRGCWGKRLAGVPQ